MFPVQDPRNPVAEIKIDPKNLTARVELQVGDTLVVELLENPTTGFRWTASVGSQLAPSADSFVPAPGSGAGGGGVRTLKFGVVAPGSGEVRVQLRREWESAAPQQSLVVLYQAK
jgi:inhibitor of cysteine peptidase